MNDAQTIIAKRIARELRDGMLVNLGIGIPTLVANYVPEGIRVFFQSENGLIGTGPIPEQGRALPFLIDAGGQPVTALPGASTFDSAMSFALIRGGHVDTTVLGGLQVDQRGMLANWMIPGKMVPGMGGAMDLVTGAKRVVVAMQHTAKGKPKIVKKVSLPLTSARPVDLLVTELAVIAFPDGRATLREIAPGTSVKQVLAATEAELFVPDSVASMAIEELTMTQIPSPPLAGQKALVLGIANEHSIAYGCACAFRKLGAELAITYLNDKAKPYVEPLARKLEAPIFEPLDVQKPGQLEHVFERVRQSWGKLDIALHAIAFAPKEDLQGGLLNCSSPGFGIAMDVSCHSFIRMARLASPLMTDGGTLLAMTYHGANKVIPTYAVMGPVKAALESAVRYLAHELGPKHIRVHAISPGPIKTRASGGLKDFDLLLNEAAERAPGGELVDIDDVGMATAYLTTPYARRLTGSTLYVDAGLNIMA